MLFLHIQYWFTWQSRSQTPPPPQKMESTLKINKSALTLESHFHRNWSAKKQGNALKSVSFKMFILPCFCWSKRCYHRNRRSSRTSPGSWELQVSFVTGLGQLPARHCRWRYPLQQVWASASWHFSSGGKPGWETLLTEHVILHCDWLKNPLKHSGADVEPPSLPVTPVVFRTHTQSSSSFFISVAGGFQCHEPFITIVMIIKGNSSCHILISC